MIAISIWLLIVMYFFVLAIGYATCWFCDKAKVGDAIMKKAYWHKQFELEKDSHKGTQKRYIELVNKLKKTEKLISEAYAEKLIDSERRRNESI